MLPLAASLAALASVHAIRGRQAEAAELTEAAARLERGMDASTAASDAVRDALAALREAGHEAHLAEALSGLPHDLRHLVQSSSLSLTEIADLHAATGATSLGELRDLLESPPAGLAPALLARARPAVAALAASRPRVPLGRAWTLADAMTVAIRETCPEVEHVLTTGSLRRFSATVGDVEVLVSSPDPSRTLARLLTLPSVDDVLHAGPAKLVARLSRHELTIRVVRPDTFVPMLAQATGSWEHVLALRARARQMGFTLTSDTFAGPDGRYDLRSEDDLYEALELSPVPPELRENTGEIEAAAARALPALVRHEEIRGDLHMHSDWSDGRDAIETMVAAAEALGYEYVALTDHSRSSTIARGLDEERLARQMDVVAAVRDRFPRLTLLQGAEVDILPDGSLDFSDTVLERLDVVLASLHDPAGHSGRRLTDRYIAAMRHPLVQVVTHPTNRLVPGRPGYELDEERLFEAAVDTGTLLEIDGAPGHLDMDGAMARRAVGAGAMVVIDGDCHRAELLGRQMFFGVATARRGWVETQHVANTQPLAELRQTLLRKRTRA
jgi:DNA polymerase (family 10)